MGVSLLRPSSRSKRVPVLYWRSYLCLVAGSDYIGILSAGSDYVTGLFRGGSVKHKRDWLEFGGSKPCLQGLGAFGLVVNLGVSWDSLYHDDFRAILGSLRETP